MSIISPLPNTLVNGTPMDAPQVMADFNQIYNDVNNNAAHSGVNGDITQLTNLSTPLSVSQGGSGLTSGLNLADGQVQISVTASTVTVTPFDGGNLVINGIQRTLSSPISVTPATAINTAYYVYAAMDVVPTMTIEISTTGWTIDAFGRKNKTGDVTRRLVGFVGTNGAGNFANTITFRGCLNYFNRRTLTAGVAVTGSTTSLTYVVGSGSVTFLSWADEATLFSVNGYLAQSILGSSGVISTYLDGAAVGAPAAMQPYANNVIGTATTGYVNNLSEGLHTASAAIKAVVSGTVSISSEILYVTLRG